jgi:hypothetical protein
MFCIIHPYEPSEEKFWKIKHIVARQQTSLGKHQLTGFSELGSSLAGLKWGDLQNRYEAEVWKHL